ncbi:MAG: dissimilatory sulfite reductase beta subunit [Clostridia bacterium]|nr:dissimilatory sulfite reductase beta subunit [Clostridia bacterium]
MAEIELPAGIMPDYRQQLPKFLKDYAGRWIGHAEVRPGVLKHWADDGQTCYTVRILLPPNGLLSAATVRRLAGWIRKYALTGRRTCRQSFELVGVAPDKIEELIAEVKASGLVVGGTGATWHQIKCCTSFVHCQNAAIDAPSIAKVLSDMLLALEEQKFPAPLKISVGGCPNQCGGGTDADIGITGVFRDPPQVDEEKLLAANEDIGLLISWCPTAAIRPKPLPEGMAVEINPARCVRCSSCAQVAPGGVSMGRERGAALSVGGQGGNSRGGPQMGAVIFPFLPAEPPDYALLKERVHSIIAYWLHEARPGEKIGSLAKRLGWGRFLAGVGVEDIESLIDDYYPARTVRRNLHFKF